MRTFAHTNRLIPPAFSSRHPAWVLNARFIRYPEKMQAVETRLRVRYAETDQMGVVYYANYLVWMEVGRVEFCRSSGIPYKDIEADGFLLAVLEVNCQYAAPARYDDELIVLTTLGDANARMPRFDYEIKDAVTGQLRAAGSTTHVWCGPDFRPRKLPEKYWPVFGMTK
jgi:acyl-CoA thioester hydrolase